MNFPVPSAVEDPLILAKQSIDSFHEFDQKKEKYYGQVSAMLDPFKHLITSHRKQNPMLSNAWLKCWEIIHKYPVLRPDLKLFCNAELPGAFLAAIFHAMSFRQWKLHWNANSLLSGLPDTFGLYERYRDHWLMDDDHDGDITKLETITHITKQKVDLYTSDIGIGLTHETFLEQEEYEAHLHLAQVLCGLKMLNVEGHMIVKTFTFQRPFSMSLLYLLSQCFQELQIFKPVTSRPGNSECYLIGLGFKECLQLDLLQETLLHWTSNNIHTEIIPVPFEFRHRLQIISRTLNACQTSAIQQTVNFISAAHQHQVRPMFRSLQLFAPDVFRNKQEIVTKWKMNNNFHEPFHLL